MNLGGRNDNYRSIFLLWADIFARTIMAPED
ncbi:MAG: iron chelate uptake ABC superfamily ATP binding cassette transporter, partial [Marinovum sp.]|nr:iron chelate uptake ABC superfamily ATP binding cassette transporter [Marinovum sp.]